MSDNNRNDNPNDNRPAAPPGAPTTVSSWERETLERLVFATVREQRAARRWGIFFKLAFILLAVFAIWVYSDFDFGSSDIDALSRHTALIEIDGAIDSEGSGSADSVIPALSRHTALIEIDGAIDSEGSGSADAVIPALNKAYSDPGSAAIILRINSPGGSPVQAGIIVDEILRLKKLYPTKPLYVVVDEICASGGYYIAAAADKIFVNKASVVGSIGVLMDGFGFTGLMDKLGIERRLLTAGENKGFLDPFSPQSEKQKQHALEMLNEIHEQFIAVVRAGRGKRLKETPEIFSGLYWTGAKAVEMGLADGFGTVDTVARDVVKAEDIIDYTAHEGLPERVLKKFGASVGEGAVHSLYRGPMPSLR